jgi:hypothetical protein
MEPGHAAEVHALNMDFYLDKDQVLENAVAWQDVKARTLDSDSEVNHGANSVEVKFQPQDKRSLLKQWTRRSFSNHYVAPKSKAVTSVQRTNG